MAIDQALLESVDAGHGPVLRLYTWSQPTLSLGYFQKLAARQAHRDSADLACVRRATGGGAIVHDRELTYSLTIPLGRVPVGPRLDLYRQTHLAVSQAFGHFDVPVVPFRMASSPAARDADPNSFLCFQRRTDEDLILHGYKVVGSAQRQTRRAVLQHGSVLMQASSAAPQLPGVCELTSRSIPIDEFAERFRLALSELLEIDWIPGQLSDQERIRATEIEAERFASRRWLERR
jgi:lipoate-protein ligase A